jgi:hypothetical protein
VATVPFLPSDANSAARNDSQVVFSITNQLDDMALIRGICYVARGYKDGDFSTTIYPRRSASVKIQATTSLGGSIDCYLVYELIDQRNGNKPVTGSHQVFIAIRVFARPSIGKYKASAVIFTAKDGIFTGKEKDITRLKDDVLRKHLVKDTYTFECSIRVKTLRLKVAFQPNLQSTIKVILETGGRVINPPAIFDDADVLDHLVLFK